MVFPCILHLAFLNEIMRYYLSRKSRGCRVHTITYKQGAPILLLLAISDNAVRVNPFMFPANGARPQKQTNPLMNPTVLFFRGSKWIILFLNRSTS